VERATVAIYEREAAAYRDRRPPKHLPRAATFSRRRLKGRPVVDLGCGPGSYAAHLPHPLVALDAAAAMLDLAHDADPRALRVRADVEALPFADRALGGAWARHSYLHVRRNRMPMALADLHWALAPGAPLMLSVAAGDAEGSRPDDDFPGRFFCCWRADQLRDVVTGAGFDVGRVDDTGESLFLGATRARSLPDTVGPGMRLLLCGLNPSEVAADAGFGFAGATNRFWAAAVEAGVVTHTRDPRRALLDDRVGMTDLVKRATPRAAEIQAKEYRAGAARVQRLVAWLRPAAVCFVGLDGWRTAVDAKARAGWQPGGFGGAPAYVMPSTSGLNARTSRSELVEHLRTAVDGEGSPA
jgi:TDG/mug DNA glycosylase family protein